MGRSYYSEWFAGYTAAKDGAEKKDNPHNILSEQGKAWAKGWNDYHVQRDEE